jgi:hypothetical protein
MELVGDVTIINIVITLFTQRMALNHCPFDTGRSRKLPQTHLYDSHTHDGTQEWISIQSCEDESSRSLA